MPAFLILGISLSGLGGTATQLHARGGGGLPAGFCHKVARGGMQWPEPTWILGLAIPQSYPSAGVWLLGGRQVAQCWIRSHAEPMFLRLYSIKSCGHGFTKIKPCCVFPSTSSPHILPEPCKSKLVSNIQLSQCPRATAWSEKSKASLETLQNNAISFCWVTRCELCNLSSTHL